MAARCFGSWGDVLWVWMCAYPVFCCGVLHALSGVFIPGFAGSAQMCVKVTDVLFCVVVPRVCVCVCVRMCAGRSVVCLALVTAGMESSPASAASDGSPRKKSAFRRLTGMFNSSVRHSFSGAVAV